MTTTGGTCCEVVTETATSGAVRPGRRIHDRALLDRFPPRAVPAAWPATLMSREQVQDHLTVPPFTQTGEWENDRRRGVRIVLGWLEDQPGDTWQDRWLAAGAEADPAADWRLLPLAWRRRGSEEEPGRRWREQVASGLRSLIAADVLRPGLAWLLSPQPFRIFAAELAQIRDPAGFAAVSACARAAPAGEKTTGTALRRIAAIVVAKGGGVTDICAGDCVELLAVAAETCRSRKARSPYFYQLLHAAGTLEASAPPTIRIIRWRGQPTIDELIDKCGIQCRPVRDLLVAYLTERQAESLDFSTLSGLADELGRLFWRDLELHHPGIGTLRLSTEIATAWKQRIKLKPARANQATGSATEPRLASGHLLVAVRMFYADIAQWAADDPGRWGMWVAPSPVKDTDIALRKTNAQRKSRIDQRTRERLPVMPTLLAYVRAAHAGTAARLKAAATTPAGELFTAGGQTLRRSRRDRATRIWAEDPGTGVRIDLTRAEEEAFWTWAIVEALHETGVRIEELTEVSHHSVIQYQTPDTGELVPLLHIAPSKTDQERLVVLGPVLADVLGAVISRIRDRTGAVPCVHRYDYHERKFDDATAPLLFQRRFGAENRPITPSAARLFLKDALAGAGITGVTGQPLTMQPHDFRRILSA
jgi:hypothetical protein